jgi:hypothetical protein
LEIAPPSQEHPRLQKEERKNKRKAEPKSIQRFCIQNSRALTDALGWDPRSPARKPASLKKTPAKRTLPNRAGRGGSTVGRTKTKHQKAWQLKTGPCVLLRQIARRDW